MRVLLQLHQQLRKQTSKSVDVLAPPSIPLHVVHKYLLPQSSCDLTNKIYRMAYIHLTSFESLDLFLKRMNVIPLH